MRSKLAAVLILAFTVSGLSITIYIPADYPTIQAGINASSPGDIVLVAPGTYYENLQMSEGITLMGSGAQNTIIDGQGQTDVVSAIQISSAAIEGFTVRNSQQGGGSPGNIGIFFNPQSSAGNKIVRNCVIRDCGNGIDIWNDFGGTAYIENNLICDNIYDGFDPYLGTVYLTNNTIVNNGRDGYSDWAGGGFVQIQNNIFAQNGRYGIFKHQNTPVYISYNDVWNNVEGAYYQGYSGPYQPFTPVPGTGELDEAPLFYGGNPFDYHLSWDNFPIPDFTKSPCIDSANPSSPSDPDGTNADMGAYFFNQQVYNISAMMTPTTTPVQVPQSGGSFDYTIELINNEPFPVRFNVWIKVSLQDRLIIGPLNMELPAGGSIIRERSQNIPGNIIPTGEYDYELVVGSYPAPVWDSDSFIFAIIPDDQLNGGANIIEISPNPFNNHSVIAFSLAAAGEAILTVYDIAGRETMVLQDGYLNAGVHRRNFDGSRMASGVYFVQLEAGAVVMTKKMILIK
ncbi:MAG: T9SS type A sorting domain-containing protein [FCB group bacterium]|nr:T9SS type A sorting domain-containing protein [FCB group bacterium]